MSYFVVIHGPLGSGKSTIAKALANKLNAWRVQIDDVLSEHGLDLHDDNDAGIPSENFIKAIDLVLPEAKKKLEAGHVVIFDGCFYHRAVMDHLLFSLKFAHVVFTLKAPLALCIERDRNRQKSLGEDAARAVYCLTEGLDFGYIIDSTKNIEDCLEDILSHLPK